ncbi:3D domain-containing protein [Oceanirhabdus sp. W0125-5]|uniref:3D domain-containing protein n=1 Tax=Oceanirhabdus sp. W0125-5 TaxID=2999116 RepID=UPI0022F3127C|nr:3D domain-containing protein [Oceanirhabdus sp. W0125-5]WBW98291.1 3D domain-containing protein [Oceanirhabdus sp. W0125-5]
MGLNVYKKKEEISFNFPKMLFIGLLVFSLMFTIVLSFKKEITIVIGNEEKKIVTFMSKTNSILKSKGIQLNDKDKISVGLNSKLKNGDLITITKAVDISLKADGEDKVIFTAEGTVREFFASEGIEIGELDKVTPSLDTKIYEKMSIQVTRVVKVKQAQNLPVEFITIEKPNNKMVKGEQKLVSHGRVGEKQVVKELTLEDGEIVDEVVLKETITKESVSEVVEVGTLTKMEVPNGETVYYSSIIQVRATAYTADLNPQGIPDDPYLGVTAVGTRCKRNPNGISTIAVDPRVIPLGTKVYVEGYGLAIAEDVGGAIKGNKIDVYVHKYSDTLKWGVRHVKVYILEEIEREQN